MQNWSMRLCILIFKCQLTITNNIIREDLAMKKVLSILVIGIVILFLLSFVPSNVLDQEASITNNDGYLTLVPAAPPTRPPIK